MPDKVNLSQLKIGAYRIIERAIGAKITRKLYLDACIRRYYKAGCIFIHIPKTAGTTIAHALLGRRAGHFTALEVKERMGVEKFESFFSFAVTRHPYDRLLSAYHYVRSGGGEHGGVRRESYFEDPAFTSFDSFVQDWLVREDLESTNLLFRPQSQFIFDDQGALLVNHVTSVNNLEGLKKILKKELGKELNFQFKNRNSEKSDHPVADHSKRIISELYHKDFELLNYDW